MGRYKHLAKTNKRKPVILAVTAILLCFALVFFVLHHMQRSTIAHDPNYDSIRGLYLEENDSLDGIYIGSSAVYRFWMAPLAYENEGMAVYSLASGSMPISSIEYLLKDAVKRQGNLKFVAIELRNISKEGGGIKSEHLKNVTDAMPWSADRCDAIKSFLEYCRSCGAKVDYNAWDYYFPILRGKGSWLEEVNEEDLRDYVNHDSYVTYKGSRPSLRRKEIDPIEVHKESTTLDSGRREVLDSLFEYCNELEAEGISVIFTLAPGDMDGRRGEYVRAVSDYCKDKGFEILDFTQKPLVDAIDFDYEKDFYNERHTSYSGAVKFTEYMSDYFRTHFDMPDHRGDKAYESWDEAAKALHKYVDK